MANSRVSYAKTDIGSSDFVTYQNTINDAIGDFGRQTKQQFNYALRQQNFSSRGGHALTNHVGVRFRQNYGTIDRIRWTYVRYGIFQERGVGRGRGIRSGREKPRPWIAPVLNAQVPLLADVLSDAAFKSFMPIIRIKVPGIFEAELKP